MIDNHTATQHEFTRRCLRYMGDEADLDEREQLEKDLPEFTTIIIEAGGYNLDAQLAALTAEQTQLRAESDSLRAALSKDTNQLKRLVKAWRDEAAGHYCQTYNTGQAKGLTVAANMLEDYVKQARRRALDSTKLKSTPTTTGETK